MQGEPRGRPPRLAAAWQAVKDGLRRDVLPGRRAATAAAPHRAHLVAGQGAQGVDVGLVLEQLPQLLRAALRQRLLHVHAAAQALHILLGVRPGDALVAAGGGLHISEAHGLRRKRGW